MPCEVVLLNIDDMPTAYDVDKVIGQLEEDGKMALYEMNEPGIYAGIQTAIEVVKEGGLR